MKLMKQLILLAVLYATTPTIAQKRAYGDGEWFKFRVHYGFVTAGYATLKVDEKN